MKKSFAAKLSAFEWVQFGHQWYVAARLLYWKRFIYHFTYIGAHALEIYLKAFIIHKTGYYKPGHELEDYYRECMRLDPFFQEKWLSECFLPEEGSKVAMPELWGDYIDALRYPEGLQQTPKIGFGIHSGDSTAGTGKSLDCIAYFMYKTITPSEKMTTVRQNLAGNAEINPNVIDNVLSGKGYYWQLGTEENASEIKELFLRHNQYFPPKRQ